MYALLDEGATISLINKDVIKQIGNNCRETNVSLQGCFSESPMMVSNRKATLNIECTKNEMNDSVKTFELRNVFVIEKLSLPIFSLPESVSRFCEISTGLRVKTFETIPEMLIGQDHCHLIITLEFREFNNFNLLMSKCLLGWSIHGTIPSNFNYKPTEVINYCKVRDLSEYHKFDQLISEYFDIESMGVTNKPRENPQHNRALRILEKTSCRIEGEWQIGLLWKKDNLEIPSSRENALFRLRLLERRFDRDREFAKLYRAEMERLLNNGFAKPISSFENSDRVWYLPHFGVTNKNKPGRVRLVFDAAAKSHGISFNDLMLPGPDLLKSLLGVIMRFRQKRVAIKADIKYMFLKIKIREEDRNAQRFLWRENEKQKEPREYEMTSMIFGAKSSPCCALFIKNKNALEFKSLYPEAVDSIINNCYMDDYLYSCDTVKEARERVRQVTLINRTANWDMHGWGSNEPKIFSDNSFLNETEGISVVSNGVQERVLGLQWNTESDKLLFKFDKDKIKSKLFDHTKIPNKRKFLSIIMSVFDPLGLLSPITVQARILLQDICTSRITWNEKLKPREFERWIWWLQELNKVEHCAIPRCYQLKGEDGVITTQLHVFCDASEKAYSSVAYWRLKSTSGKIHTSFIFAKSKVAPLKPLSIPRLELQAAVLGIRLAETILKEHVMTVEKVQYWSDSRTVLHWIKTDPRVYKMFVMTRLGEICEKSNALDWRWVPSRENPADDGTKWAPESLQNDSRWFLGPEFLRKEEICWPVDTFKDQGKIDNVECEKRVKIVCSLTERKLLQLSTVLPDQSRFSSWKRLLKSSTRVIEAVDIWRKRYVDFSRLERQEYAEKLWLLEIQKVVFVEERESLKKHSCLSRDSRLKNLTPYIDEDGLIRVRGRITFLPGSRERFEPVILDAKHAVVKLIIQHYHEKYYHKSHETVCNEIQQKYWILGLRKQLRSIINKCIICRMLRAPPANPKMSKLPSCRLEYLQSPFFSCGLDYFGPFFVKIGRRREKHWGALFTCMTVRAIHLELAHNLSADSAIMAVQRFAARRGFPRKIFSDNGTNFRGASKEIKTALKIMNKEKQIEFGLKNDFEWNFNPPKASHMGGAWERLIRSVKEALYFTLKDHAPAEETLLTVFAEIEHSINSRPLIKVPLDPLEKEAITPNHFLIGRSSGTVRISRYDLQTKCLRKQWLLAQRFADACWNRWLLSYLPSLLSRKKWLLPDEPLKTGDIVLIAEDKMPRNNWCKGLIVKTFPDSDGQVRVVEIKTEQGNLTRPSRKIVKFTQVQNT